MKLFAFVPGWFTMRAKTVRPPTTKRSIERASVVYASLYLPFSRRVCPCRSGPFDPCAAFGQMG